MELLVSWIFFCPHLSIALTRKGACPCRPLSGQCSSVVSDPLYLFKSLTEPCLEGCGPERIGQIVDAIDAMDSLSAEVATLQTMLSSAQEMKLDSEGRIMLNTDFIAFAELDKSALYAGIGRSFQIWLPSRYRRRESDSRSRKNQRPPKPASEPGKSHLTW